jgi:GNAT superfamily N-acetyltransferase
LVEIREVKTAKQLADFCKYPLKLYADCPQHIPDVIYDEINMFKSKKTNPALDFCDAVCYLAYRDGKIVGRIAGIISRAANEKWGTRRVRFSRIDFEKDIEIAKALLDAVESWGAAHGMEEIQGPIGFCDLDQEGMLVEGFEYPGMLVSIYNYAYYPETMDKLGFKKEADWLEFQIQNPKEPNERIHRLAEAVLRRYDLTLITPKTRKEVSRLVRPILDIINRTYDVLYGTVKLTDALLDKYYNQYKLLINPEYVRVIKNANGDLIGFGLAMPSFNDAVKKSKGRLFPFGWYRMLRSPYKKANVLDLYLVGVLPEVQNMGLPAVLMDSINRTAIQNGVRYAETGPELELNNKVQSLWKLYDVKQHKRRRCYTKTIAKKA